MSHENETLNHEDDYTTPGLPDEWMQVRRIADTLKHEQHRLAHVIRRVESGEAGAPVDPLAELRTTNDTIKKALPNLTFSPEGGPMDVTPRELLASYWQQVAQRRNSASTGFRRLNDVLSGGFETKRLVILLGAPNTGKTTFAHQLADYIADDGRPVLYVTSEDTPGALFAKTLARVGQISYTAVLKGWPQERAKIDAALMAQMDRKSLDRLRYLDATNGITLAHIREKAKQHFALFTAEHGGGPGIIFIDYLQQIARDIRTLSGSQLDPREIVTLVVKQFRALAIELECSVVAISSQSRSGYTRSETQGALASAKESGDIEYCADVLLALTEDKDKNRVAPPGQTPILLHVDKNRQGEKNKSIAYNFLGARQMFTEVEV